MCVQWWLPPGGLCCPVDGDELDPVDGDELEDVAAWVDVVLALAEPPVDARATPATPPPSAAAIAAVTTSRRMRPAVLDAIRLLLWCVAQDLAAPAPGEEQPAWADRAEAWMALSARYERVTSHSGLTRGGAAHGRQRVPDPLA
jgi:hypothetical protein